MRIYLDDDLDSNRLIDLLRLAGHEVISPRAVGTRGVADQEHLQYAFSHGLVLLTANAEDFIDLHEKWMAQQKDHAGILIVYRENNPFRDLTLQEIVQSVTHIEQSDITLNNSFQNLNFWRGN
jgi:predicted nuclease of predicted toxin-antitoxin system